MTQVKHTLGAWELTNEITGCVAVRKPEYQMVASVYPCQPTDARPFEEWPRKAEMLANARLIAASPDLLEAAKSVINLFNYQGEDATDYAAHVEAKLKAAIAKAEAA